MYGEVNLDMTSPDQHFLGQDSETEHQSQGPPMRLEVQFGAQLRSRGSTLSLRPQSHGSGDQTAASKETMPQQYSCKGGRHGSGKETQWVTSSSFFLFRILNLEI